MPAQTILKPLSRYLFALDGFDAVRSIVASTKVANDFEISSTGRSFRKTRCSIASRIMVWNSTNGALPASLDSLVSTSDTCSCASTLRCLGICNAPLHVTIPNMSQPGTNILLSREIRHHGVCEFQLDLPIERVDQIILGPEIFKGPEICKKSSLGNSG